MMNKKRVEKELKKRYSKAEKIIKNSRIFLSRTR